MKHTPSTIMVRGGFFLSFFLEKFFIKKQYNAQVKAEIKTRTKILITASLFSIYLAIFFSVQVFGKTGINNNQLQVSFLDIGQGDSIYIKAPNGRDMLIDGGRTSGLLEKKLKNAMAPGDNNIDVVIVTHPDADHIGGIGSVLENYNVGQFLEPGIISETKTYKELLASLVQRKVPHLIARTGTVIALDTEKNITFTVLAPDFIYDGENSNDASVSGLLVYGEQSFMLTGDAPTSVEETIVRENTGKENIINISTDVLKLGHHGSKTSSSETFLKAIKPSLAVISAGCKNTYGHPSKEVIARLETLKIPTVSTCESGTITFFTDGLALTMKKEK